ncbi:MAG: DUF433 domain-containing protein [Cytophagales bacterium]|nr:DUF433 domain-containing protein [Cytophagales bacterium]
MNRWISKYWDSQFGLEFNDKYSWSDGKSKAISFHTLIEIYTFYQLSEAGVHSRKIIEAHKILSERFETVFPFATSHILESISTDGKKIYFKDLENIFSVDKTHQFHFTFISEFFKKIDFDGGDFANRLWPIGKEKSVVVDPKHQFGQPTISGTNINAQTINGYFLGGEQVEFIADIFNLEVHQITDAIDFCKKAA